MSSSRKEKILFAICLPLFIAHQLSERLIHFQIPPADSYLDPLLCLPIILPLVRAERSFILRETDYTLKPVHITAYFVLISVLAELIFPRLNSAFTADPIDVICYAIGGCTYYAATRQ